MKTEKRIKNSRQINSYERSFTIILKDAKMKIFKPLSVLGTQKSMIKQTAFVFILFFAVPSIPISAFDNKSAEWSYFSGIATCRTITYSLIVVFFTYFVFISSKETPWLLEKRTCLFAAKNPA